jgi:hypothetical protein
MAYYSDDTIKAKLSSLNDAQDVIVNVAQWLLFNKLVNLLLSHLKSVLTRLFSQEKCSPNGRAVDAKAQRLAASKTASSHISRKWWVSSALIL